MRAGPTRFTARLTLAALLVMPAAGQAVTPLSPNLARASRLSLEEALSRSGISDVGGSAVLNSLLAVLGTAPAARSYRYREPYPQLPFVDAEAAPVDMECARVELTVQPKAENGHPLAITGTYCLSDVARFTWGERALSIKTR